MSKRKKKKADPVMYVGPTIPGIGIQNRVYTEIPAGASKMTEVVPETKNLFIKISDYPKANKMLREGAGYINQAFEKALIFKTKK